MFRKVFLSSMLVGCMLLAGCVIQPVNNSGVGMDQSLPANESEMDSVTFENAGVKGYMLSPLDPIMVQFSGVMEQQGLQLVIDSRGEISLLHLKAPIKAAGLTTSQLEEAIEAAYVKGGIYKNLSVNVTMTAKVFYVQGQVNAPGQFQLISGTTLLQAIASARGYTSFANKKKVTITREGKSYTFNAKDLEKDPSKDQKVRAGDVIHVPEQWY